MPGPITVLGIAGSLRERSYNRALLRAAIELAPEGMTIETFEQLGEIPLFNADVETRGLPEPVQHLKDRIRAADGVLIVTAEYNYSIPGVLKNAIDWASRPARESPWNGKPLALMSVSGNTTGGVRAQLHLRQVVLYLNMFPINKPEVFVTFAAQKFDENLNLIDEPTRDAVRRELEAFAEWIERLR